MSSKLLPQESRPLITYRYFFLGSGGNSQHFFWPSFLLMKRRPRALQEIKAKAPEPEGILKGTKSRFFSLRGETKIKRGDGGLKLIPFGVG
uniref:NADH dehydrogenase subunit 5 n=1 Tax=Rhizophora mucronata TaxID=61149 RepID=A0A2P2MWC4_RHIMU